MAKTKLYLNPRLPSGAEPCADLNADKAGDCCLDVHLKNYASLIGRARFSWLVIWGGVFVFLFFSGSAVYSGDDILETLLIPPAVALLLAVPILLIAYRVSKNQSPLRFCRKNRKVYLYLKKKFYTFNWDTIHAYTQTLAMIAPTGTPYSEPHLIIELDDNKDSPTWVLISGSETCKTPVPKHLQSLAIWEYIHVFMEHGPDHLPDPDPRTPYLSLEEIKSGKKLNPFPIAGDDNLFWQIMTTLFFPVRAIFFITAYPTDFIYYYFHKKFIKPFVFPEEFKVPSVNDCGLEQVKVPLTPLQKRREELKQMAKDDPNMTYISHETTANEHKEKIDKD